MEESIQVLVLIGNVEDELDCSSGLGNSNRSFVSIYAILSRYGPLLYTPGTSTYCPLASSRQTLAIPRASVWSLTDAPSLVVNDDAFSNTAIRGSLEDQDVWRVSAPILLDFDYWTLDCR